jgi:hypothetical protein
MPPPETGNRLSDEEISLLRRWIAEGAAYAEHWAFVAPMRPEIPLTRTRHATRPATGHFADSPIDALVLNSLQSVGLSPASPADRSGLIRRLSFDLRGLPPSPEEVAEFVNDRSQNAYERLVDRFLADPAYGERWARVWLDLARYADSRGYGSDPLRTNMWSYRDWVIDAFNSNLAYDRFTLEQIAGDLLPHSTIDQRIATAFHRNTMTNSEGGTDDEEFRVAAVMDRVDTTLQVWMGLTMGCAKCHSHKFDPISQREYYSVFACLNQTADADRPDDSPVMDVPGDGQLEETERIDEEIGRIEAEIARLAAVEPKEGRAGMADTAAPSLETLKKSIMELKQSRPQIATLPIMQELPAEKRRSTHVLVKANFLVPGEAVEPGLPAALHPPPGDIEPGRLALAHWLVDRRNPLTARVAVNRLWAQLFGLGIVETEEDFGTQGVAPSHSDLLDWMAVDLMDLGWDIKQALRKMVTSATYRQSSVVTDVHLARDPRNVFLSRGPRFRLDAEMIRDQALAVSGLICRKLHGPSVFPPQPEGLWRAAFNNERTWATSQGRDRYRRGLYVFWRRTVPYPSMATFDAPSREVCSVRRLRTNTPLQAFVTMNDPVYIEAAQALARRIVQEGGESAADRTEFALRLCLGRPPRAEELREIESLLRDAQKHLHAEPASAEALATDPLGPVPPGMDHVELAAWTVVSNVLLNLDGVLTKG